MLLCYYISSCHYSTIFPLYCQYYMHFSINSHLLCKSLLFIFTDQIDRIEYNNQTPLTVTGREKETSAFFMQKPQPSIHQFYRLQTQFINHPRINSCPQHQLVDIDILVRSMSPGPYNRICKSKRNRSRYSVGIRVPRNCP